MDKLVGGGEERRSAKSYGWTLIRVFSFSVSFSVSSASGDEGKNRVS